MLGHCKRATQKMRLFFRLYIVPVGTQTA